MEETQISVRFNNQLLFELDKYILLQKNARRKEHITRQGIISEAVTQYLKIHCGIPFMVAMSKEKK